MRAAVKSRFSCAPSYRVPPGLNRGTYKLKADQLKVLPTNVARDVMKAIAAAGGSNELCTAFPVGNDHEIRIIGRKDVLEQAVQATGGPVPGVRSFLRKWRSLGESNPSFQIENCKLSELYQHVKQFAGAKPQLEESMGYRVIAKQSLGRNYNAGQIWSSPSKER